MDLLFGEYPDGGRLFCGGLMVIFGFCEGVEYVECVFGRVLNVCFYTPTLTIGRVKGDKVFAFVIFEALFHVRKA